MNYQLPCQKHLFDLLWEGSCRVYLSPNVSEPISHGDTVLLVEESIDSKDAQPRRLKFLVLARIDSGGIPGPLTCLCLADAPIFADAGGDDGQPASTPRVYEAEHFDLPTIQLDRPHLPRKGPGPPTSNRPTPPAEGGFAGLDTWVLIDEHHRASPITYPHHLAPRRLDRGNLVTESELIRCSCGSTLWRDRVTGATVETVCEACEAPAPQTAEKT